MFHGNSCIHCHRMMPIVDKLIKEGFKITKKEVWEDEKNAQEMRSLKHIITPACGDGLGTPAFVDTKNKKAMCGECSYDELKQWLKR